MPKPKLWILGPGRVTECLCQIGIASPKRSGLVLDYLRREGAAESDLARVHAPAGLDLGAKATEEIALSVLSEIVLHRRGGSGEPMRNKAQQRSPEEVAAAWLRHTN